MQFLIYIHCHVVIILPLRCYSSNKRYRLYNQPAKIYSKSSLMICMLTCFTLSHNTNNLLKEICHGFILRKVLGKVLEITGAPQVLCSALKYKKGYKVFCEVNFPVLFDCTRSYFLCSFKYRLLPSSSGKTPFDFSSHIVRCYGFCPSSLLNAVLLAFLAAVKTSEALTPVFTYSTRRQTYVSLYFLNITFWGKLSAIISGVSLNLYFCSVECRCHLECKRELSEPSVLYLLSALTVTVYESLGYAIHYTFWRGY